MPRGRKFTAEQINGKLRAAEVGLAQGRTVPEVVRRRGVTGQTSYRWKREYGGLRTDQARRRQAVAHVRETLGRDVVTERRACRVLRRARNTQRRRASDAADEPQLVRRIVSMARERVLERLSDLLVRTGVPDDIRRHSGSWCAATRVREWRARVGVKTPSIEPGSPWENGSVESFNGKLRDELLA